MYKAQGRVLKVMENSVVVMKGMPQQGIYAFQRNEVEGSSCICKFTSRNQGGDCKKMIP
jgi:hypothetical protein